jgi:hypothetical protein
VIKSEELSNPNSCLNKAKDNEWIFVLLERDPALVATLRKWVEERVRLGLNKPSDQKIIDVENAIEILILKGLVPNGSR